MQYDCSAADINPIGSISKQDLRRFLKWAAIDLGFSSLAEIEAAPPTAELEPIRSDYSQVTFRMLSDHIDSHDLNSCLLTLFDFPTRFFSLSNLALHTHIAQL